MRGSAALLVLLFCLSGSQAQGERGGFEGSSLEGKGLNHKQTSDRTTTTTSTTPDLWAELRALRDMVVEQRVELRNVEDRLRDSEVLGEGQRLELGITKTKVLELETENAVVLCKAGSWSMCSTLGLRNVEDRLRDSEVLGEGQRLELGITKTKVLELETENADLALRLTASEGKVEEMNREGTGIFTAPVKGAYYFRFTARELRGSHWMGVQLYHNDRRVQFNAAYIGQPNEKYISNALILEIERGDVVYMRLNSGQGVSDNTDNLNTFTGFLLFTV